MSFWSGPPRPPPLETPFLDLLRDVGGGGGGGVAGFQKMTTPFLGLKIMNVLVFFDFEPKKCSRVTTPWGLHGAECVQLMHFPAIFAMLAVLATSVTLW